MFCFLVVDGQSSPKENLFGSKIKEEPIEYDDDDECNSDEYADGYGDGYGDPYDEDDTFIQSNLFVAFFCFY